MRFVGIWTPDPAPGHLTRHLVEKIDDPVTLRQLTSDAKPEPGGGKHMTLLIENREPGRAHRRG